MHRDYISLFTCAYVYGYRPEQVGFSFSEGMLAKEKWIRLKINSLADEITICLGMFSTTYITLF